MTKLYYCLLAVLVSITLTVEAQDCTEVRVSQCLGIFDGTQILKDINAPIDADLPNWNETLSQLRDRCRSYMLFSQCMSSVIKFCNTSYQDYFIGLNEGYTFLCASDEELQKLVAYQKCYGLEKVRLVEIYCNTTYMGKIDSLKYTEPGYERVSQFCSYTDTYLKCLTTSVESLCSPEASEWQRKWNVKKRRSQMQTTFNCPGWTSSDDSSATIWTIILSVVLGLTTLIMIIGILVILVFINRKKKSHRRAAVPPPPPYTSDPFGPYDGPAPVVSADTNEPSVTLPGRSLSNSSDGATGGYSVAVNMRPTNKCPVKPPPYADQTAPAYESASGAAAAAVASSPGNQGQVNQGYQNSEGAKGETEEEEDIHPGTSEPGAAAAGNVTESERELNTNWF